MKRALLAISILLALNLTACMHMNPMQTEDTKKTHKVEKKHVKHEKKMGGGIGLGFVAF